MPVTQIISLADAKTKLGVTGTGADPQIQDLVDGLTPVVEYLTGPVLSVDVDEWYDGGDWQIQTLKAPIVAVASVTETFGANVVRTLTEQPLDGATPVDAYGFTVDLETGLITRRVSGIAAPFAIGRRNVHIVYTAGRAAVPANIRLGMLELVRVNWQQAEQGGRPAFRNTSSAYDDEPGEFMLGFLVPNRVADMLAPSRTTWGIA